MVWTPHVTVAAVVQCGDQFLMVEEAPEGAAVLNQPAGHLEAGESLVEAVMREVREETAYDFVATGLVGVYQWQVPRSERTYLRFCFIGQVADHIPEREIDPAITAVHWLSRREIASGKVAPRSPLVMRCIDDAGARPALPIDSLVQVVEQQP